GFFLSEILSAACKKRKGAAKLPFYLNRHENLLSQSIPLQLLTQLYQPSSRVLQKKCSFFLKQSVSKKYTRPGIKKSRSNGSGF
ncbi:MAG: hypothetical protein O2862_05565, partial [Bacteroidetes bacterium]|nr:hypothetical protein [Bacteroidota bacterium]